MTISNVLPSKRTSAFLNERITERGNRTKQEIAVLTSQDFETILETVLHARNTGDITKFEKFAAALRASDERLVLAFGRRYFPITSRKGNLAMVKGRKAKDFKWSLARAQREKLFTIGLPKRPTQAASYTALTYAKRLLAAHKTAMDKLTSREVKRLETYIQEHGFEKLVSYTE